MTTATRGARRKRLSDRPQLVNVVPYKTVYVVWFDHSAAGVWPTKQAARRAVRVLVSQSLGKVKFLIAGPYKLTEAAQ